MTSGVVSCAIRSMSLARGFGDWALPSTRVRSLTASTTAERQTAARHVKYKERIIRAFYPDTAMLNDFRLGARIFRRHASLASAAVLSLALGIGANTAISSVLHTVVLNALPYEDPERLMMVWETSTANAERWVAPANFVDWRREIRSFSSLAAFDE